MPTTWSGPAGCRACVEGLRHADIVAGAFDFWSLNGTRRSPDAPAAIRQLGFLPAGLGANLAVRKSVFDGVGGFNEDLLLGEDIDLCWRLQLQGFHFAFAPEAVVAKRERDRVREDLPEGVLLRPVAGPPSTGATGRTAPTAT